MNTELIENLRWEAKAVKEDANITYAFTPEQLNKFAELIVKECVDTMREQSYNTSMLLTNPPKSSAVWDACNAIEKKFGVK
jgi:hypothetical protein